MIATRHTIAKFLIIAFAAFLPLSFSANGLAADITQQQLLKRLDSDTAPLVLDVRRPDEYAAGHVPKAINIPHTELEKRLNELGADKNSEVVVYCESGRRAAIAMDILQQAGFTEVIHLTGDMKAWRQHALPQEGAGSQAAP